MYDGTLGTKGPWEALVTFQQMLVLCDRHGVLDMTPEVLSRRTLIPLEIITKGIAELEKPDEHSRRADFDGRRIVRLDEDRNWGWQIVNHAHYRAIRSSEERRDYQRTLMRERRAADKVKREEQKSAAPADQLLLPDWLIHKAWTDWIKIRPARARTIEAQRAALAKLEAFKAKGLDPNDIVATSLANGWQGLFSPDQKKGAHNAAIGPAPDGKITCRGCGVRVSEHTDRMCRPCYAKR